MNNQKKWLIAAGLVIALLGAAVLWFMPESRSLGVIGGADGPTAIFVATIK